MPDKTTNKDQSPGIYAHSLPDQPQNKWQTLSDHSNQVAQTASEFAAPIQSETWAWNAGQLHDIGKTDSRFQAYLLRSNGLDDSNYDVSGQGKVNHSSAGADCGVFLIHFQSTRASSIVSGPTPKVWAQHITIKLVNYKFQSTPAVRRATFFICNQT